MRAFSARRRRTICFAATLRSAFTSGVVLLVVLFLSALFPDRLLNFHLRGEFLVDPANPVRSYV
jgi:hypothetical protein